MMSVYTLMGKSKPNMNVVDQVRTKLESKGMFNPEYIDQLKDKLKNQRKSVGFFAFSKKRELDLTISALNYLLETKTEKN